MDPGRVIAAVVIGFFGLSCLAGFFRAFRERLYLALLGLAFIVLAVEIVIPGPAWLRYGLLGLMGLFFILAAVLAVMQTMAQVRIIQEHRKGLEREMWAYLEELKKRTDQTEQKAEETSAGDAPHGPDTSDKPAAAEETAEGPEQSEREAPGA
jgi:hypothetical protein